MMIYDVIQQGGTAEEAMDMARGMVWSEVEAAEAAEALRASIDADTFREANDSSLVAPDGDIRAEVHQQFWIEAE